MGLMSLPLLSNPVNRVAPSDRVRVAHIGLGKQGNAHVNWFRALPEVETAALCDVDQVILGTTHKRFSARSGAHIDIYTDFRRLLDRKDIDVITCATPDHWHALIAMMAFEAGKDVYGEKPLSYTHAEGVEMLESLRKHKAVFQLGNQIHASENFHRVTELVQSGKLGKIHTVRLWKTGGSPGLGFPSPETPPATLDWNMWLGPSPYTDYIPVKCHRSYRYFLDYSGGVFGDFWCHIADILYTALHPRGLKSVESRGERPYDGIADTPKWIDVDLKYDDLDVFWTTIPPVVPGSDNMHIGAHFEGTEGTLTCDYDNIFIQIDKEVVRDLPEVPRTIIRSPGHQQNFIDAVKSRQQPESNLEYARDMTIPMHLALISFRLKRKLEWDSENEKFVGDEAANLLLSRKNRAPWSL
jgi:predicted dehydrogenase